MSIIDGLGGRPRLSEMGNDDRVRNNPGKAAAGTTAGKANASDDSVQITDGASRMQEAQSKLAKEPAFDQAKVDRIKQLLSDGEYAVDAQKVADRFMALERAGSL